MAGRGGTRYGNGVGKGQGWGGPARGAGTRLEPNHTYNTMDIETRRKLRERKEELAEEMKAKIYELALAAKRQETQLSAAMALLDRLEGKAISRNVNMDVDDPNKLTDAELERIARMGLSDNGPASDEALN